MLPLKTWGKWALIGVAAGLSADISLSILARVILKSKGTE